MKTTVLIADDHRIFREGLRRILESRPGIEVVGEAGDGVAALEWIRSAEPDVALVDISMPRLSGIEVIRQLAKEALDTRAIVLSAHETHAHVAQALKAGAVGYVVKGDGASELFEAVEAVRAGKSYLSPTIAHGVVQAMTRGGDVRTSATSSLTDRELEVLRHIAEGLSSKEIASALGVSAKTVDTHRANLMSKLKVRKVSRLVRVAIQEGLVST